MWEQNQDSIGSVEYSVDEGATWLPLVYHFDNGDVIHDGGGNIDGLATMAGVIGTSVYFDCALEKHAVYLPLANPMPNRCPAVSHAAGDDIRKGRSIWYQHNFNANCVLWF